MNTKSRLTVASVQKAPRIAARAKRFAVVSLVIGVCIVRLAGCATTSADGFNVAANQIVDNMSGS